MVDTLSSRVEVRLRIFSLVAILLSACATLTPLGMVQGPALEQVRLDPDEGVPWQGYWLTRKDAVQSVVWARLSLDAKLGYFQMWNLDEALLSVKLELKSIEQREAEEFRGSWDIVDVQRHTTMNVLPAMKPGSVLHCRIMLTDAKIMERMCAVDLEPPADDPLHMWHREGL